MKAKVTDQNCSVDHYYNLTHDPVLVDGRLLAFLPAGPVSLMML